MLKGFFRKRKEKPEEVSEGKQPAQERAEEDFEPEFIEILKSGQESPKIDSEEERRGPSALPLAEEEKPVGENEENVRRDENLPGKEMPAPDELPAGSGKEPEPAQDRTIFEALDESVKESDEFKKQESEMAASISAPEGKQEETASQEPQKKGFFARLREGLDKTKNAISQSVDNVLASFRTIDDELYEELEEALIMADIGVETSSFIIESLKENVREKKLREVSELKGEIQEIIRNILTNQDSRMHVEGAPAVIMVIGVNGVGKTTSIGKMAHYYKQKGKKVLLAAADTFRAAAIDQLQIWADRAGVDIVKHQEGSDPSAVVFDAIAAAKARGMDLVICDTAGRLHNKKNLMDELAKTARVIERETGAPAGEVLLVLDASTGQNALIQAREFAKVTKITGVILTKLDGTAKGGVLIALSREQGIGVKLVGVGEGMDDLQEFDPEEFAKALFPEEEN